ncbi:MAG: DUF1634 domain-containing protein [Acidobacteriaceae bacterium]
MSWNDKRIETWVGIMLRTGVMLAAAVVLIGGAMYLAHSHGARPDYSQFHGETVQLMTMHGIVHGVGKGDPRSIIMLGLLILIATPVARVGMCVVGFLFERDRMYVVVSSLVLLILLYSLFFHK